MAAIMRGVRPAAKVAGVAAWGGAGYIAAEPKSDTPRLQTAARAAIAGTVFGGAAHGLNKSTIALHNKLLRVRGQRRYAAHVLRTIRAAKKGTLEASYWRAIPKLKQAGRKLSESEATWKMARHLTHRLGGLFGTAAIAAPVVGAGVIAYQTFKKPTPPATVTPTIPTPIPKPPPAVAKVYKRAGKKQREEWESKALRLEEWQKAREQLRQQGVRYYGGPRG